MKWLGASIILILIIVGIFLTTQGNPAQDTNVTEPEAFDTAPSFSLQDYSGNTVTLEDSAGTVRVVNSWASWCPFCVNELPDFVEAQEQFGDAVTIIAINRRESLSESEGFTDELGISEKITFLLDPDDSFYRSIGGFAMPETLFVDEEGFIRVHKRGFMTLEEISQNIGDILSTTKP